MADKKRIRIAIFILIFLLGAVLRIGYFNLNTQNMDGHDEPWSKLNLALYWIQNDNYKIDSNFGPLHTYMISTIWLLNPRDYVILSRLVSLIFGILFILLYFYVLKDLLGLDAAYLGTFLLAIYPLHVHLCSVSLAEIPASFLLFSSLYFLYRSIVSGRFYYLILSAILLNLSSMLRFESWLFIFLFSAILFFKKKPLRHIIIFSSLASIFLVDWLIYNYRATGDPIHFVKVSSFITAQAMEGVGLPQRIFGFVWALYVTLSPPIFFCGIAGFIFAATKKVKNNIFLFLFFSLFLFYVYRSIRSAYDYTIFRYSLVLGLLFIPLGVGVLRLCPSKKFVKMLFLGLLTVTCLFYSIKTTLFFYTQNRIPPSLLEAVSWIKSHMGNDEKVLLECGVFHPFIVLNAGLTSRQQAPYDHQEIIKSGSLEKYIHDADYVVIHKDMGIFKDAVYNIKPARKFKAVFENNDWRILKIK